ncbi:MAG: metallophosphoesterase [Acidobacteriota bacterium]|nr:metallophosphoesterase [Acidobacteriota bacterium]
MTRLNTFRHPQHSIFQSLVEGVASKLGDTLGLDSGAPERGNSADQPRLGPGHPAADVAHAITQHQAAQPADAPQPVPETPPKDLQEKHPGVVHKLWDCARLAAEALAAKHRGDLAKALAKRDELDFSSCDPRWAESVTTYLSFLDSNAHGKIPYVRYRRMSDFVLPTLPADAKVALVGDWGTGTSDAIALMRQVAKHQPDVVIHLGDIYYSGTPEETKKFFLDIVDEVFERDKQPVAVYNLTGNHDMYSGGAGYYGLLPQLNPPPLFSAAQAQRASYFALRSDAWQLLAMDTGLHDRDPFTVSSDVTFLDPKEEDWHVDKIRSFSRGGGRTVLLSHHQLFSAHERIGGDDTVKPTGEEATNPKLMSSYRKFQQAAAEGTGDLAAWFWGHEHNLCVYQPTLGLAKGRCIGHGAIPALVEADPYAPNPKVPNPPQMVEDPANPGQPLRLGVVDESYAHGFVILRLDDQRRQATASYYQETDWSRPMYREVL